MNNFFQIKFDLSKEMCGVSPQGKIHETKPDHDMFYEEYEILPSNFDLPFDHIVLAYHAKWTDLLYINGIPSGRSVLVISDNLLQVLRNFSLAPMKVWENIPVVKKEVNKQYNLVFCYNNSLTTLDFIRSEFFLTESPSIKALKSIKIKSPEDYKFQTKTFSEQFKQNPQQKLRAVKLKLPVFREGIGLDLFRLRGPISGYFVSEKLKEAILDNGCTGITFLPIKSLQNVIF